MEALYLAYIGAAIAATLSLLGAAYSISSMTSKAVEAIARQPQAANDIKSAMQLPVLLIEGAGLVGVAVPLLITLLK